MNTDFPADYPDFDSKKEKIEREKLKQSIKEAEIRCRACETFALWKSDSVKGFHDNRHELPYMLLATAHPESCYKCEDYVTCKTLHWEDQTKTEFLLR